MTLIEWWTGLHNVTITLLVVIAAIATGLSLASYVVGSRMTSSHHLWFCTGSLLLIGIAVGIMIAVVIVVHTFHLSV